MTVSKKEKEKKGHPSNQVQLANDVLPTVLPVYKELEEIDFQVHHWEIKDWSSMEQRSHGSLFEAAGFKW